MSNAGLICRLMYQILKFSNVFYLFFLLPQHKSLRSVQEHNYLCDISDEKLSVSCFVEVCLVLGFHNEVSHRSLYARKTCDNHANNTLF